MKYTKLEFNKEKQFEQSINFIIQYICLFKIRKFQNGFIVHTCRFAYLNFRW